jgi:acyl carrier protein
MLIAAADLTARIHQQVVMTLDQRQPAKAGSFACVLPEQDLRELGLDSLGTVNLMLAIEGEFDIFIPQDQMKPQNFRTIAAIAAMVGNIAIAA